MMTRFINSHGVGTVSEINYSINEKVDGSDMDFVLEVKEDALKEIAKLAVSQNTGARGLRAIIEDSLMDLMYKVPDQKNLYKVVINKEVIAKKSDPILIYSNKENNQKLMSNNS